MQLTVTTMIVIAFILIIVVYCLYNVLKWIKQPPIITVNAEVHILGSIKIKSEHYALITVTVHNTSINDVVIKSVTTAVRGMTQKDIKKWQDIDKLYPTNFPINIESNRHITLKPALGAKICAGCNQQFKRIIFITEGINMINMVATVKVIKPIITNIKVSKVYSFSR